TRMCKSAAGRRLLMAPFRGVVMRPVAAAGPLARASLFALAAAIPVARLGAQGWIVPRPCISFVSPAIEPGARPLPARDCRPNITRTQSDVRVELVDRVLRYEVDERFVNRGGTVAEADYLFPLPNGAAFQDLKLSIDGHLVAGETMRAASTRRSFAPSAIRRSSSGWATASCAPASFPSTRARSGASSSASRASRRAKATHSASTTSAAARR